MPALKTPKYTDHPAEGLSKLISTDVKEQFLKTPKKLLIENPIYNDKLSELRNHFNYSYLIQWIYSLKHLIKLQDAFDVENFEEELLNIAPPIFINNLKIKLIQYLKNEKLQNIDIEFDFYVDQIYQDFKLIEFDDNDNENDNNEPIITYSKLSLIEKIDVLYNLVKLSNTKSYSNFRKIIDKFDKPQDSMKIHPIFIIDKKIKNNDNNNNNNIREEYIILQDARLYLRKIELPKLSKNIDFINIDIEPKLIHWECLTTNIYQYDNMITTLKKSFGKKSSSNEFQLSKVLEVNLDFIIQHDLKKRKQGAQRKREIEMQLLMANRKRSSRLEEKEKRKREEEEARMKEFELIKQQAAELRAAKRQKLKNDLYGNSIVLDSSITREERLKKRHELNVPSTDVNNSDIIEIDPNQIPGNTFEMPTMILDDSEIIGESSNIVPNSTQTESITVKQDTSEPVTSEPAAVEPVTSEPAAVEPFTSEPAAVEPVKLEPAAVEPVTSEPAAVEPIQAAQTDSDKPSVNNVEEPVQPISK